jgi:hypothetical protein
LPNISSCNVLFKFFITLMDYNMYVLFDHKLFCWGAPT